MKRSAIFIISCLMIVIMIVEFAGCGQESAASEGNTQPAQQAPSSTEQQQLIAGQTSFSTETGETLPLYSGAVGSEIPNDLKQTFDSNKVSSFEGYLVSAASEDVMTWYRKYMKDWTLQDIPNKSDPNIQYFKKDSEGVLVYTRENFSESKTLLIIAYGPWPNIECCEMPMVVDSDGEDFNEGTQTAADPVKENIREILALCSQEAADAYRYSLDDLELRYPGLKDILNLNFSGLTYFPLSLEKLYWEDDPVAGENKERGFEPFANHLSEAHPYGPGCWYMHPGRRLPVVLAGDAVVTDWLNKSLDDKIRESNQWEAVYDGIEVYEEAALNCYFSPDVYVQYGHLAILKSLVDEIKAKGVIHLAAGTVIGYVENGPSGRFMAPDFRLMDLSVNNEISTGSSWVDHLVCPLTYFTEDMQSKILEYYNKYTYADMVKLGTFPEPWIDGPLNINIEDTVWGVWYHQTGLAPGLQGGNEEYPRAVISFINPSKWSTETFHNPPTIDPYRSELPENLSGLYGESIGEPLIYPEITAYGNSYLFLIEGDNASGIFQMESIDTGTVVFMKYAIVPGGDDELDNLLGVKYFSTLEAARADEMTEGTVVYSRQWEIVRGIR